MSSQPFLRIQAESERQQDCWLQPQESASPLPLIQRGVRRTPSVNDTTGQMVWAAELQHRGQQVHGAPLARRAIRHARRSRCSRRQRHTHHRLAHFANPCHPPGWLPPSIESRMATITTWVARLRRLRPIGALSLELVRFDTQLLENHEIRGVEYQQGTLAGYEIREYLLEKWDRQCVYCHATQVQLQIEYIVPKSRGGSDRVSNLTLACQSCNDAKGNRTAEEFGHPELQAQAQAQARQPLADAAAVNITRWALLRLLRATGLPLEMDTGGRTKWKRARRALAKAYWTDAACVAASTPERLVLSAGLRPLAIAAMGRESRQMRRVYRFGFPRTTAKGARRVQGFQTGDLVRAVVPSGARVGIYVGRVAVRSRGWFNIRTAGGAITDSSARCCRLVQRTDGYLCSLVAQKGGAALPLVG
jgi:5-methylcytosine-specific restriction endonuclease McrA